MAGLGDLLSRLVGGAPDGEELLGPVADMIAGKGGITGLVRQLQDGGLRDQVASWVGPGENAKADPRQLALAIGPDSMRELARKTGLPVERLARDLGQLIPNLVDAVTPGGSIPGADQARELAGRIPGAEQIKDQAGALLGRLLGGADAAGADEAPSG